MKKNFIFAKSVLFFIFMLSAVLYNVLPGKSAIMFISLASLSYFMTFSASLITVFVSYGAILCTFYFTNPGTMMFYEAFRILLFICPAAIFIGQALKKKFDFKTTYTYAVLIYVLCIMVHMLKISWFDKVNIVDSYIRLPIKILLASSTQLAQTAFSDPGVYSSGEFIEMAVSTISYSSPSFLIIFAMVALLICLILSKKVIRLFNREETFSNMVSFSHLKIKRSTSLALLLMYLLSLFSSGIFGIVVGNIVSILCVMCMGCGLSVIDFYFKKYIKTSFIRAFIYISGFLIISLVLSLVLFINPLMILMFIGIIDATRDFRKIDIFKINLYFK